MNTFENKMVAVVNEKVEPGKAMNAVAHMCMGFGATIGAEALRLTEYKDANGGSHPNISEMPFIILKANSNKIRLIRNQAIENGIRFTAFTDAMTVGTFQEQLERSSQTKEEDLIYFGIVLFGPWDKVSEITRKYSIYK